EKVDARRPDVVLLDVRMPDLSGYEVCRRIKTVGATAGTQVIFVTVRTEEQDLLQGFEALANYYVTKPFSARELKARVKNALRIKELLDTLTARTQILELQQDISAKTEEDDVTTEDFRTRLLVPILDRISSVFGADGVTLHVRRTGFVELNAAASTTWPGGRPPEFVDEVEAVKRTAEVGREGDEV